jgi:signal transduction histidine kinase
MTVSISRKLRRLSVLGSATALLAASVALLGVQLLEVRSSLLERLVTVADLLAFNSAAAVDFNDAEDATRTLSALKTRPSVVSAGIVSQGRVFALYVRQGAAPPSKATLQPTAKGYRFTRSDLIVYRPVISGGRRLGTLFVQDDLQEIGQTFRRFAAITGIVAIPALAIAILISMVAQRAISAPILNLASLAELVRTKKDYSIRSPEHRDVAEIEQLVETFNDMLSEIQRQQATLEERVRERTQALEERSRELEAQERELDATNKELEAFSYSVSHDLRAPLRAIDGFSKILLAECSSQLDEQGMHYLERVRAGTQRMGSLIDDLLELSRVSRRELDRREIDLSALGHLVIDELTRLRPERHVEWRIQPGLRTFADSRLMTIALENLLGNAWKFTAHRSDACVEMGQTADAGETVFFVRDNGAGFDMKYAGKLFGAFQRLHADSEFEGTGIGLATVQRIIHRHGGRVWAEAVKGKGAQFYFTLGDRPNDDKDHSSG